MSHLNDFETVVSDQEALIRALGRVGITRSQIEVHNEAQNMQAYHKEDRTKKSHIIVRKNVTGSMSDIGWENVDGKYIAHIDDYNYGQRIKVDQNWQNKLYTYYNVEKSKMSLEKRGIEYTESLYKGKPRLVGRFKTKSSGIQIKL